MLTPQAMTQPMEVAKAVIEAHEQTGTALLTCWMGEEQVSPARKILEDAGIPAFRMPETAVEPTTISRPTTGTRSCCCRRRCRPAATSGRKPKAPRC